MFKKITIVFLWIIITKSVFASEELVIAFNTGMFSGVDPRDVSAVVELYATEIVNEMNVNMSSIYTSKVLLYNSENEYNSIANNESADLICMTALSYLKLKNKNAIQPILVASQKNLGEQYYVIVHKDFQINDLNDLKDMRLLLPSGDRRIIAEMWLCTELWNYNRSTIQNHFLEIKAIDRPAQLILPVFFKQADAAVCHADAYEAMSILNPQIGQNLKILRKSDYLAYMITACRTGITAELKQEVIKAAKNIHEHPNGKQILTLFKQEKVVLYDEEQLVSLKKLLSSYESIFKANN
jgi:hypothetical protein